MTDPARGSAQGSSGSSSLPAAGIAGSPKALAEPADRGRLDIAERAVERISTTAASEVEGVTGVSSTLGRVVGRQYPKASAQVAGSRARVQLDIAIAWPASLAEVTAAVRDAVRTRLHDLAGMQVDAVDVTAAKVVHVEPASPRRVQ